MAGQFKTGNVIVGAAAVFIQPYLPGTPPVVPADTVAFVDVTDPTSTSWPSPWVSVGATKEGITFGGQRQTQNITIEEQSTPAGIYTTSNALAIVATLMEDTLETMKLAWGGGVITTVAPATGVPGTRTLVLSESVGIFSVGFEGKGPEGLWRRVMVPQMQPTANLQTPYRRAAAAREYPITWNAICPISSVVIKDWNLAGL